MKTFTLEYWEEDGWYVRRLIEVPGAFSQGESLDELRENIQDFYRIMIESHSSSAPRGQVENVTPQETQKKLFIEFIEFIGLLCCQTQATQVTVFNN